MCSTTRRKSGAPPRAKKAPHGSTGGHAGDAGAAGCGQVGARPYPIESAHAMGFDHGDPTFVGNLDYYSDPYLNRLNPGPNSCVTR